MASLCFPELSLQFFGPAGKMYPLVLSLCKCGCRLTSPARPVFELSALLDSMLDHLTPQNVSLALHGWRMVLFPYFFMTPHHVRLIPSDPTSVCLPASFSSPAVPWLIFEFRPVPARLFTQFGQGADDSSTFVAYPILIWRTSSPLMALSCCSFWLC